MTTMREAIRVCEGAMRVTATGRTLRAVDDGEGPGADAAEKPAAKPAATDRIEFENRYFRVKATPKGFAVYGNPQTPLGDSETWMTPAHKKATYAKAFYRFVTDNQDKIMGMTLREFSKALIDAGIEKHVY